MLIKQLRRQHADFNPDLLQKHRDLFCGGDEFHKRITRYLLQNEQEPPVVYRRRCAQSHYLNYCGPIGNYFASWLFTSKLTFKTDPENVDEFYEEFKEDCDLDGTDLEHFMRHRFTDALIDRCAYWRVEFPAQPPEGAEKETLAEWKANKRGRAVLVHVPASSIVNWKRDADGFVWLVEYTNECGLEDPADEDETVTETWTIWRRDENHQRFQCSYRRGQKPSDSDSAPEIEMPWMQGQIAGIPIVDLSLPAELWMMNLVADAQLESFRKRNGLSWAIDRSCYAMPVFSMKNRQRPPKMGAGYYLMIGAEDKAGYMSPEAASFAVVREYATDIKDEIHRVTQQMARGVDNNAAAVGRSGASKAADDLATEIVLAGFGQHVRDAVERTMDMISDGRGDDIEHTVGGMSTYHITDAKSFAEIALAAHGIEIPSATHHRLMAKRASGLFLPDVDEKDRQQIDREIDAGITPESVAAADAQAEEAPHVNEGADRGAQGMGEGAGEPPTTAAVREPKTAA